MSQRAAETALVNLAIQGMSACTGILLARYLGAHGRGELATALVWPTLIAGMAALGSEVAFARLAARERNRLRQVYRAMLRTIALLSACAMLVGYLVLPHVLPREKEALLPLCNLLLLIVPFSLASVLCANVALGLGDHKTYNSIRVIFSLCYVLSVALTTAIFTPSVSFIGACFFLSAVMPAVYGLITLGRAMRTSGGGALRIPEVLGSATPFAAVTIAQAAVSNMPVAILAIAASSQAVGLFVVAMVAASVHTGIGSAIGRILFAKMNTERTDPRCWLAPMFRQLCVLYGLLAVGLAAPLPWLLPLIFGDEFREAGLLSTGLVVATSLVSLFSVLEETLRAAGKAQQILAVQAAGGAVLVIVFMSAAALEQYGMLLALLFAAFIQLWLMVHFVSRTFGLNLRDLTVIEVSDVRALISRGRSYLE